jgi:hypothetical protein
MGGSSGLRRKMLFMRSRETTTNHPMVTIWYSAHHREMHTWDTGREHGIRERIYGGIPAKERVGDYNSKGWPQSFEGSCSCPKAN